MRCLMMGALLTAAGGCVGMQGSNQALPSSEGAFAALQGASIEQLAESLGRPDLRRREPTAEVWSYFGRHCRVHVFLYRRGATARYAVAHIEADGENAADGAKCLPRRSTRQLAGLREG